MVVPFWTIAIGVGIFAVDSVAVWERPPLTSRGRLFYALTGLSGLVSGSLWLLWNAVACRYSMPRPPSVPDTSLAEVLGRMLALDGYLASSLVATAICAVAIWWLLKAVFGPEYQEVEGQAPHIGEVGAAEGGGVRSL